MPRLPSRVTLRELGKASEKEVAVMPRSLRRYQPDQVPRVSSQSVAPTCAGMPLAVFLRVIQASGGRGCQAQPGPSGMPTSSGWTSGAAVRTPSEPRVSPGDANRRPFGPSPSPAGTWPQRTALGMVRRAIRSRHPKRPWRGGCATCYARRTTPSRPLTATGSAAAPGPPCRDGSAESRPGTRFRAAPCRAPAARGRTPSAPRRGRASGCPRSRRRAAW